MSINSKLSVHFTSFGGRSWKLLELALSAVLIGDNGVGLTVTELIGLVMDVASVPDMMLVTDLPNGWYDSQTYENTISKIENHCYVENYRKLKPTYSQYCMLLLATHTNDSYTSKDPSGGIIIQHGA